MRRSRFIAAALLSTTLAGCSTPDNAPPQSTGQLAFNPEELSDGMRPQDDFYGHVNSSWQQQTDIPAEWPRYGVVIKLVERTEQQIRTLIDELNEAEHDDGTEAQKISDLYLSFMDQETIEARGLQDLQNDFERIDAISSYDDIPRYMGNALADGITGPADFYIDVDGNNPDKNLIYFWQSGLSLPDRDYYLTDNDKFNLIREQFGQHIKQLFEIAGLQDAEEAASSIPKIEKALAEIQWTRVKSRDRETIYSNKFDNRNAQQLTQEFDWNEFTNAIGAGDALSESVHVIAQTDYFAGLGPVIKRFTVEEWQHYFRLRLLKHYAPYLSKDIGDENFSFDGKILRGQQEQRPRDKRAIRLVNRAGGEMLGKLYVERYFPPAYKQRMEELVENLRAAYAMSINELEWMSPVTKDAALLKLKAFNSKIGYPDKWRDYSKLQISQTDLSGNVRRANRFEHKRQIAKLSQPVDRSDWGMTPQTVNAYYRPTFNEIVFPAAFLQKPFFDPDADDAHNYAAIGSVIGHEFSHGFDDQGRKFDAKGRLRNWWTDADAERFEQLSAGLVAQYNAFQPLPDVNLNGELTLGENIADLAGLVTAWKAYKLSLNGADAPVIDGYTAEQRFFIGYALSNRSKWRDEFLRKILLSDPHSPDRYRVMGVLPNIELFYQTFDVNEGDDMYLAPDERVKIW